MLIKKVLIATLLLVTPVACSRTSTETPREEQQKTAAQQQPPAVQQPQPEQPAPSVSAQQPDSTARVPAPTERREARTTRSKSQQPTGEYKAPPPENRQSENNQGGEVVPPSPTRRADGSGTTADNTWEEAKPVTPAPPPKPTTATLPEGSVVDIRLTDSLSSRTNQVGDKFAGTLERDLVVGGDLLARKGSRVTGKISDVAGAGKVKGLARMTVTLTGIQVGIERYALDTNSVTVEAENTKSRDAKVIGGGAAIGAAIGAIAGGGKGAAIGAAVGGGAGTAGVLTTRGKEVEFQPEQKFSFRLEKDVTMQIQ